MSTGRIPPSADSGEQRLDAALSKALQAPPLPADFHNRLNAAIARMPESDAIQTLRARLEREHRQQLAELDASYVRMRRRTLTALIAGAFAAGGVAAALLPWLTEMLGPAALFVLAVLGALAGLAIGFTSWTRVSI
jgi:hypothetical protein